MDATTLLTRLQPNLKDVLRHVLPDYLMPSRAKLEEQMALVRNELMDDEFHLCQCGECTGQYQDEEDEEEEDEEDEDSEDNLRMWQSKILRNKRRRWSVYYKHGARRSVHYNGVVRELAGMTLGRAVGWRIRRWLTNRGVAHSRRLLLRGTREFATVIARTRVRGPTRLDL